MIHPTTAKNIQKYLINSKLYDEGVKILIPIVTASNVILQKAKEIADNDPSNIIANVKALRSWAQNNVSDKRLKELGYKSDSSNASHYGKSLSLAIAKTISEIFIKNYIAIPNQVLKKYFSDSLHEFTNKLYENVGEYSVRQLKLPSFDNIQYKEYNPYNLTKQSKDMFGGILNAI
jgi:hypothetical protein